MAPTIFHTPTHLPIHIVPDPQTLFPLRLGQNTITPVLRFINRIKPTGFLIYTDGYCMRYGGQIPKTGCAFVYKDTNQSLEAIPSNNYVRFRLEEEGPTGVKHPQTSDRAELRAVIAALGFREWSREGFSSVVIATDSTYVVDGITCWVNAWVGRDWKTRTGQPVMNQDLWECLIGEVRRCGQNGLRVKFWRIPKRWNEAGDHAKHAAATGSVRKQFTDIVDGFMLDDAT